jgi:uncharacterized protein (TIGR02145 family)
VSSAIPYTGGNGGTYTSQSVSSTGVTGLTATRAAGTLLSGSGSVTYTITGTPSTSGTASFAISLGGQSCTLTRTVTSGTVAGITAHICGATNVHNGAVTYGTMTDQEGTQYRTVTIGTQTWMAENLRTTKYRNNTPILNLTNGFEWTSNTTGAYCSYLNRTTNDCPYGKLYNWYAVNNTNQLCPIGWHVPTDAEWNVLIANLDPSYDPTIIGSQSTTAGGNMKSTGTQYWLSPNFGATNSSGFSGLPGGYRDSDGPFVAIGENGIWWSSTKRSTTIAWFLLSYSVGGVTRGVANEAEGFSVRCLRD